MRDGGRERREAVGEGEDRETDRYMDTGSGSGRQKDPAGEM